MIEFISKYKVDCNQSGKFKYLKHFVNQNDKTRKIQIKETNSIKC